APVASVYLPRSAFRFRRSDPRGALPTFPTRRSSDLAVRRGVAAVPGRFVHLHPAADDPGRPGRRGRGAVCAGGAGPAPAAGGGRSEEHTSELQSRFDLVCRRLLDTEETAECGRLV